ncbi:hypothetical protein A3E46_00950 [Candidatus Woesebacteria bacterium RIFCSPHIGHO2_12_FULL_46_16]|uniref:DUF458 domain-containing protein n=1 Tax=Candidatus Woesebacteria bacterium RIFCSPHIGHO2_12_FULL_46_16 TaxID=1802513 RepID=A0A1F8AWM0_9BACT|nr:MAG: hypothetical protein A3E46_00950 [Candidatus Woesebacteria bacterium RIFCSPHIGHO2_12_FULL_46_16]
MNDKKYKFISPTKGELGVSQVISEIEDFVNEEPRSFYRLVIGSDSQTKAINGKAEINFVTAIVVHRRGRGARYFWKKEKRYVKVPVLRDKIYTETTMSLEIAEEFVPEIRKRISPAKYDLEIHIDVGPLGPTREMIREVVGMVNGNGYVAKTKPESWGASSVADKHT